MNNEHLQDSLRVKLSRGIKKHVYARQLYVPIQIYEYILKLNIIKTSTQ